jgi:hypothetical protein
MEKRTPAQILSDEIQNLPWRKNVSIYYARIFSAVEEILHEDDSSSISEAGKKIQDALSDGEFLFSVFGVCDDFQDAFNREAVDELVDDVKLAVYRIERRRNNARLLRTQKRDVSRRLAFIGLCMGMNPDEIVSSVREEKVIDIYRKAAQIFAPPRRRRIQRWRKAR